MPRGMLVAVGVAAALVMVGCGNDLSDSTSTTTAAESTTTSEEDSTTTEEDSTTTSEASSNGDDLAAQFESDFGMTSDQATCFVDELGADLDESGVENVASSGGPEDLSEDEALATKDAFIDCLLLPELEGQFTGADADCVADEAAAYVDEQYPRSQGVPGLHNSVGHRHRHRVRRRHGPGHRGEVHGDRHLAERVASSE